MRVLPRAGLMGVHDLLVVAGEASGDLHAASLLTELRGMGSSVRAFGLGGDALAAAGLEPTAHSSEISVVGITEALRILRRARQIFDELIDEVERRRAKTALLVDFPDFNLALAKSLKKRGVRVIYYISPQVWAWRPGRVKTIAKFVDRMLVVFPFEVEFYRSHGVEVTHVGHPLVDLIPDLPQVWDQGGDHGREPYHIALLPGSRRSEITRLLPVLVAAARRLKEELPVRFSLIKAPTIQRRMLESELAAAGLEVAVVEEDRFGAVASAHLALCASGTATLEAGLLGTPMIVVYRVSPGTYLLAKLLAHSRYAAMVNVLLEREVVPELIQSRAEPQAICCQAVELLNNHDRIATMRASLKQLRPILGGPGASHRAALELFRRLPDVMTDDHAPAR